jgi:hypothetical protein
MATYVVEIKFPYERVSSTFGVLHSSSDTLFSPTFTEEEVLIAHMFAQEYSGSNLYRDCTEDGQHRLVRDIRAFLEEHFPAFREHMSELPAPWQGPDFREQEEGAFLNDSSDLVQWYEDCDPRADAVQLEFCEWRRARL